MILEGGLALALTWLLSQMLRSSKIPKAACRRWWRMAQVYTCELATDAALQLLEMGFAKPSN
ncbi:MAG: hypothetical protein C5B50_02090 [Verrucomicrobia bacterium]|nr:MAG: hypothetical protein C5B50_02090 [Verrucomicrobiota bacterium]